MERHTTPTHAAFNVVPNNAGTCHPSTMPLSSLRALRRSELRQMVPLADSTIYEMERRGEFPKRFNLTARCVVWNLAEVEAWLVDRRRASEKAQIKRAPSPDVHRRKTRPVKTPAL